MTRSLWTRGSATLTPVVLLALAACDDKGSSPSQDAGTDGSGADTGADTTTDGGEDTGVEPDSNVDSGPDTTDTGTDGSGEDTAPPQQVVFLSVPQETAAAGQFYHYRPEYAPREGVDLVLADAPENAELDASGELVWPVPELGVAQANFTLEARRGDETAASQQFTVTVGHAPIFTNRPGPAGTVDVIYLFSPAVEDEDGDPVELVLENAPRWLSLSGDGTLTGIPTAEGLFDVSLVASDPLGLSTRLAWSIEVIEGRIISSRVGYMTSDGGTLSLYGCCFDGRVDVFWGSQQADSVEVASGGAELRASFSRLGIGEQPVVVELAGREVASLPDRLLVIPSALASARNGQYHVQVATPFRPGGAPRISIPDGVTGTRPVGPVAASYVGDVLSLDADPGAEGVRGGVVEVAIDDIGSLPSGIGGAGVPSLLSATPAVHTGGDALRLGFAGVAEGAPVAVTWSESGSTVVARGNVSGGEVSVTVPPTAAGLLQATVDGTEATTYVAAGAASDALNASPSVAWANRRVLRADVESEVLLRGIGLNNPALALDVDGGSARMVWASDYEAVVAVRSSGTGTAVLSGGTGDSRTPLWTFSVVGAERSFGATQRTPTVAAGEQRTFEEGPAGFGAALFANGVYVAAAPDGLWMSAPTETTRFGVPLGTSWTRFGDVVPGNTVALRDIAILGGDLYTLTTAGDLFRIAAGGSRAQLTSPWAAELPAAGGLLPESRLAGLTAIAPFSDFFIGLSPTDGTIYAISPSASDGIFGVSVDPQDFEPVLDLGGPVHDDSFLAVGSRCVVVGEPARLRSYSLRGALQVDLNSPSAVPTIEGTLAAGLGGGLYGGVIRGDTLYLLDRAGQLLAADAPGGCPAATSPIRVLDSNLTGSLALEATAESVVLSGAGRLGEVSPFAVTWLRATTARAPLRPARVLDAWFSDDGLLVSDGQSVGLTSLTGESLLGTCDGTACFDAAQLAGYADGVAYAFDPGRPGLATATSSTLAWSDLSRGPFDAPADSSPLDARVVGLVAPGVPLLSSANGGIWVAVQRPVTGLPSFVPVGISAPDVALVGGAGAQPAADGVALSEAGLLPRAAAVDASDRLWIADDDGAVYALETDGTLAAFSALSSNLPGCVANPSSFRADSLAVDAEGNLMLVDARGGAVMALNPAGMLCQTGLGGQGHDPAARLYGAGPLVRGGGRGVAFVDATTGVATALSPVP